MPRIVWILAGSRFATAVASFAILFLFLFLTGPRGLTPAAAGIISGLTGAGSIAGSFTGGWFADRFGHRRTMLAGSAVGGAGLLATPWLPTAVLVAALPLATYALACSSVAQGALVAVAADAGKRRTAIAVSRSASNAGFIIGPLIGAVLAAHSYTWLFVIEGAAVLLVRQIVARLLPADAAPAASAGGRPPRLWPALRADRRLLMLLPAILAVDVVYRQLYSTLPLYLTDGGHGVGLYAALIATGSGAILCLEVPVAVWLRKAPALAVIGTGYALVGAGFGLFGLGTATGLVVAAMLVVTAGEILYKTTATAHLADAAPPGLVGRYQGLYTGLATGGVVLSPPVGAALYELGPGPLWTVCAVTAGLAAAAAWASGVRRARPTGPRLEHVTPPG